MLEVRWRGPAIFSDFQKYILSLLAFEKSKLKNVNGLHTNRSV